MIKVLKRTRKDLRPDAVVLCPNCGSKLRVESIDYEKDKYEIRFTCPVCEEYVYPPIELVKWIPQGELTEEEVEEIEIRKAQFFRGEM